MISLQSRDFGAWIEFRVSQSVLAEAFWQTEQHVSSTKLHGNMDINHVQFRAKEFFHGCCFLVIHNFNCIRKTFLILNKSLSEISFYFICFSSLMVNSHKSKFFFSVLSSSGATQHLDLCIAHSRHSTNMKAQMDGSTNHFFNSLTRYRSVLWKWSWLE